jgi:phosphate acetyltransferase
MFDELIAALKAAKKKTIVFTEGTDARILEATDRLVKGGFLQPILVGNDKDVKAAAKKDGFNIDGVEIVDPLNYKGMDDMVAKMVELRKGKMTAEECAEKLKHSNYFGTMLVKMGKADCLLGGATYSTADTVRPALQLIKCKPGNNNVSGTFIMVREKDGKEEKYAMGDCAITIHPNEDQLVESAVETAKIAKKFGIDPKVAFLSFSTKGSAKDDTVTLMQNACKRAKEAMPDIPVDGEMQFDAAVSPVVGQLKFPGSSVAGYANTFIFPDVNAGNIGYKIAQRFGGFAAYGPLLLGLNAPINDLSRGCVADEVYKMAIITASQTL